MSCSALKAEENQVQHVLDTFSFDQFKWDLLK